MLNKEYPSFFINKRKIGIKYPTYFIAEIGSNFDGDLNRAKDLIYLAKEYGAEAAKFQHYTAEGLVSDFGFRSLSRIKSHQSNWQSSVFDTYKKASLNEEWTEELYLTCQKVGIEFMTSPYSLDLIEYVNKFVNCFKVGSGDITWIEAIKFMASKGKPILLATGASNQEEVNRAVGAIKEHTNEIVLMQCNTNYSGSKSNLKNINLNVLKNFQESFPDTVLGLSDHTPGFITVIGSVALGARVIEKHFTDDNSRNGPDHSFALDPKAWKEMVDYTRDLEESLGSGIKEIESNEKETVILQRRSIRAKKNIKAGDTIKKENINFLRPCPCDAIDPSSFKDVEGKELVNDVSEGDIIRYLDLM